MNQLQKRRSELRLRILDNEREGKGKEGRGTEEEH